MYRTKFKLRLYCAHLCCVGGHKEYSAMSRRNSLRVFYRSFGAVCAIGSSGSKPEHVDYEIQLFVSDLHIGVVV